MHKGKRTGQSFYHLSHTHTLFSKVVSLVPMVHCGRYSHCTILNICCSPANCKYFTLTRTGFVSRVLRERLPASWLNTAVATPYRRHVILQKAGPSLSLSPFSVFSMCFVDKQGNTLAGRLYVLPPPPLLHTWNVHLTHLIQFTTPRTENKRAHLLGN